MTEKSAAEPAAVPAKTTNYPDKAPIAYDERGLELRSIDQVWRFCVIAVKSGMAPKAIDTPEKALVAIQYGAELGFNAMRALTAINVINGIPSLKGEAILALIRKSGVCTFGPLVDNEGTGDARNGFMLFERKGLPRVKVEFTVADAKRAGLWGKTGTWTQHPDTMLRWRAVGIAGKSYFSDLLLGMAPTEEVEDYEPPPRRVTVTRLAEPDPLLEVGTEVSSPKPDPGETETESSAPGEGER